VGQVGSVEVINDYTVRLNLSAWDNLILTHLAVDGTTFIVSPTAIEKNGVDWAVLHPRGTGPFKVEEFDRNLSVKLERFDDYWEEGLPYLDGLEIDIIPDRMTSMASLKAGEVKILFSLDMRQVVELKTMPRFHIVPTEGNHVILLPNSKDPNSPFADKRVRQAVEYAIDKETICKSLGYGYLQPVYQIIHSCPGNPGTVPRKYNPDKAKELLVEAGYPDGFKTKVLAVSFYPKDQLVAIQSDLAKVGIDMEVQMNPAATQMGYLGKGGIGNNLALFSIPMATNALYGANAFLPSSSWLCPEMKRTPGFDDLISKAVHERDPEKVTALLDQAEKLAYDDAMFIITWNDPFISVFSPNVRDYQWFMAGGPDYRLSKAWLSKE